MKNRKLQLVTALLIVAAISIPAAAEIVGQCPMQVTFNWETLILGEKTVEQIFNSPFVRAQEGFEGIHVELNGSTGKPGLSTFFVELHGEKDITAAEAADIFEKLAEQLRKTVQKDFLAKKDKVQQRLQEAEDRKQNARIELFGLKEQQRNLRESAGHINLEKGDILARIGQLQDNAQETRMEFEIIDARRKAIDEQIYRLNEKIDMALANDTTLDELGKILQYRHEYIEKLSEQKRLLTEKSAEEELDIPLERQMLKERQKLAEIRIGLAERQEHLREMAGGGMLGELNNQMTNIAIESAELHARLKFVTEELERIEKGNILELAYQMEQTEFDVKMAEHAYRRAFDQITNIKMELAKMASLPTVTVLGKD